MYMSSTNIEQILAYAMLSELADLYSNKAISSFDKMFLIVFLYFKDDLKFQLNFSVLG